MSDFFAGIDTSRTSFEVEVGGDFEPIPAGTRVVATCEEASDTTYGNDRYINLKWRVNLPKEHANRVLFQKVKIYDDDEARKTRARQMLAAIAQNAGGKLFTTMQQNGESEPSDASLQTLTNTPMVLKLDVWEMEVNGQKKTGNWVQAVSKYERSGSQPAPTHTPPKPAPNVSFDADDIPF